MSTAPINRRLKQMRILRAIGIMDMVAATQPLGNIVNRCHYSKCGRAWLYPFRKHGSCARLMKIVLFFIVSYMCVCFVLQNVNKHKINISVPPVQTSHSLHIFYFHSVRSWGKRLFLRFRLPHRIAHTVPETHKKWWGKKVKNCDHMRTFKRSHYCLIGLVDLARRLFVNF